jgi:hypothetical protein
LNVSQSNLTQVDYGIVWNSTSELPQCSIHNSQINAKSGCILLTNATACQIANNLFFMAADAASGAPAILGDPLYSTITGNTFIGLNGSTPPNGVVLSSGAGYNNITANEFQGFATCVTLQAGATYNTIGQNTYNSGTAVADSGSNNIVFWGAATPTSHGILLGQGVAGITTTAAMSDGQLLVGQSGADPLPKTLSGDVTLSAAGALTLESIITAGGPIGSATVAPVITYDAKGRLTAVSTATIAPPFSEITGTAQVNQGGTGLTGGNSGGIPYFSGASALASSAALGAGNIMIGGGAGVAPSTVSAWSLSSTALSAVSSSAYTPQTILHNSGADASAPFWTSIKSRGGAAITAGDGLGFFEFQGYDSGNTPRTGVRIYAESTAVASGNISAFLALYTANAGAVTERIRIPPPGGLVIGTAAIATNATDGFLYIPSCAGTPTGSPTAYSGRIPLVYDSTNNYLYVYNGGWKKSTVYA